MAVPKLSKEDAVNLLGENATVKEATALFQTQEKNAADVLYWFMAGRKASPVKGK